MGFMERWLAPSPKEKEENRTELIQRLQTERASLEVRLGNIKLYQASGDATREDADQAEAYEKEIAKIDATLKNLNYY